MRYIALLRGVNVGGHNIKMERLREVVSTLGFDDVHTYIQSGNVFFESPETNRAMLTAKLEACLRQEFGFDIPVCLRSVEEFETILSSDPFKGIELAPDVRFCVYFAVHAIPPIVDLPKDSPKGDMTVVGATPHELFAVWRIVNGRPPASEKFLQELLGGPATARFFHTSQKILAAAKAS